MQELIVLIAINHCKYQIFSLEHIPFGMVMPGRHGGSSDYRFGYQGSEKDNEVKGNGNSYTTEFRQYDPRLGRWLSIDPITHPWQSPYCAMDNNPIRFNDTDGQKVGGDKGKELRKEEKKLNREAQKLSRNEKQWAKNYIRENGGTLEEKRDENNYKRYYVGRDDGNGVIAQRGSGWGDLYQKISDNKDALYGKHYEVGDQIGIQISMGANFFVGGGMSYSLDFVFVGDSKVIGSTIGGGLGIEAGASIDVKFIYATKAGRYTAEDIQDGTGFEFGIGVGPLSYSRSGDMAKGEYAFRWDGNSNTGHGGLFSSGYELMKGIGGLKTAISPTNYNQVIKLLSSGIGQGIKIRAGGSYQWTTSSTIMSY